LKGYSTMMQSIQRLSVPQRRLVFFLIFGGILLALIGVTVLLVGSALNASRPLARALVDTVSVHEFAQLPGDDAYPASVAAWQDGAYTGSYATGAIWSIDIMGTVTEIPNTRDQIGAAVGLAFAPDFSFYVVDQLDTDPRTGGGDIKRVTSSGEVTTIATIEDERGFIAPDDIAVDGAGRIYVSDRGRNEVWRFDGGSGVLWWTPPNPESIVTGLAYDSTRDAIVVTDPEQDMIYRVPVAGGSGEVLYARPENAANTPGFDGVTVTPDGVVYVAALGINGVARLEDDGTLTYIAGGFRGVSDVDYSPGGMLYVTNFDQSSLVLPLVEPRLPFALDVIDLTEEP
jgi:hypothetical protein